MFCEPCFSVDLEIQATHFFKTCDDPESLCLTWANHHTKQMLTKNHELSDNMQEFQKRKYSKKYHNLFMKILFIFTKNYVYSKA